VRHAGGRPCRDDAHLYVWTTNAFMVEAPTSPERGDSSPRPPSWTKVQGRPGSPWTGYYFRGATEHVVSVCVGKPPLPMRCRAVHGLPVAPHWQALSEARSFGDLVEQVSRPVPYVELFARQPRLGWDHWGHGYEMGGAA
jgi:N6-adenosine-specific RNA methylase IME4